MKSSDQQDWLEARFEESRTRLRLLAFRMLGTLAEADDAVQESWLKISRSDTSAVKNFDGWLTTVTSRVCIDMLRTRKARKETLVGLEVDGTARRPATIDPEREVLLAESIGSALLIVLEELSPAERVSFVLHDMFDVPFDEVAAIAGRSETAVRQLASRARRRVRGMPPRADADAVREREIVQAFYAASREGNFEALLELLSPDALFRADEAGVRLGAGKMVRGSVAIAERVLRGAGEGEVHYALVNGRPSVVGTVFGEPRVIVAFTIEDGKITEIRLSADPEVVAGLDVVFMAG